MVDGKELYVLDQGKLVRIDLPGTVKWAVGMENGLIHLDKKLVLVERTGEAEKDIVALDRETGGEVWTLPMEKGVFLKAVSDGLLILWTEGRMMAVDVNTRQTKWTVELSEQTLLQQSTVKGDLLVAEEFRGDLLDGVVVVREASTGKKVWERPLDSDGSVIGNVLLASEDGDTLGVDLRTGKTLWTRKEEWMQSNTATAAGFAAVSSGTAVRMLKPETGEVVWQLPLPESNAYSNFFTVEPFDGWILIIEDGFYALVDMEGRVAWSLPENEFVGKLLWTDGTTAVVDDQGVFAMQAGDYPPLPQDPAARRMLAQEMLRELRNLSRAEIARITALGKDAFPLVLSAYLQKANELEGVSRRDRAESDVLSTLSHLLVEMTTKEEADVIEAALRAQKPKTRAAFLLESFFQEYAEPSRVLHLYLQALQPSLLSGAGDGRDIDKVEYVAHSSDPEAVKFALTVLQSPEAPNEWRELFYHNLARVGGAEGREAVAKLQMRTVDELPGLAERMKLNEEDEEAAELLDEFTDGDGRTWGLFNSVILGNGNDLWVAEKVDGAWIRPLFTGVQSGSFSKTPSAAYQGKTAAEIVAGAWKTLFVNRPEFARDTDGDGLTDLMERRLGTDAGQVDSDGDGRSDLIDPFPLTKPRTNLSELEQVMAAAFEARHRFAWRTDRPAVITVEGAAPFELAGWQGPVLWEDDKSATEVPDQYWNGMAIIELSIPEEPRSPEQIRDGIYQVRISTYYGGLDGETHLVTVQKFGDRFLVIESLMESQS